MMNLEEELQKIQDDSGNFYIDEEPIVDISDLYHMIEILQDLLNKKGLVVEDHIHCFSVTMGKHHPELQLQEHTYRGCSCTNKYILYSFLYQQK